MSSRPQNSLEIGDAQLAGYVRRWRAALEDAPDEGYTALVDAISQRQARCIDVDISDWVATGDTQLAHAHALLEQVDEAGLGRLWNEPHALGWFHQHFGEVERDASNRAHTRDEHKHASQTVTTQLYTPRWIADFLVGTAVDTADNPTPAVCDPAVGGGQMLLAALSTLVERGVSLADAVGGLHGVDLDARAVRIAQRSLKLHAARLIGRRKPALEEVIDANLRVDDGLFGRLDGPFDIVVTNPPYMGSRSMPAKLKERIRERFRPFHADLYTAFIRRCHELSADTVGVLAQQTVWFLSRFAKARSWLLDQAQLVSFMHLGPHAFATLSGEKASVAAFIQKTGANEVSETAFIDLRGFGDAHAKCSEFADSREEITHTEPAASFDILPGRVLAHWLPASLRRHFDGGRRLADIADIPGNQNKTADNRRYVKKWSEVDAGELRSAPEIIGEAGSDDGRWVFYSKGGRFAPWWGNWQNVVDWSQAARAFYADNRTSNLLAEKWWFKEGICYTDFGGRTFNARLMPAGCVFDMAGPAIFPRGGSPDRLYALMAVLNSTPVRALLNAMNPSLHYQVRDLRNLPVPEFGAELEAELARRARRLVEEMRQVAAFVPHSPRYAFAGGEDTHAVGEFLAQLTHLEHDLDRMICELYGCPQLLIEPEARPVHDYVGRVGDRLDPVL